MSYARPGDILSRRKGLVMHRGVSLGGGRVLHNTPFHGEHVCTEEEFRAGRRMYVHQVEGGARRQARHRARGHAPKSYNLFTNNCEHTVTRHLHGRAKSPQLRSWLVGSGLAAVTFAVTRHPAATVAAYAAGRKVAGRFK